MLSFLGRKSRSTNQAVESPNVITPHCLPFSSYLNTLKLVCQQIDKFKINPQLIESQFNFELELFSAVVSQLVNSVKNNIPQQIFLSHYKVQAGTSAQLLKSSFESKFNSKKLKCFLDSDDLENIEMLSSHVLLSQKFYLILSPIVSNTNKFGPFSRPYCLVEIITWYLNKNTIQGFVVIQQQDGIESAKFPSSQKEVNQLIDSHWWDIVRNATSLRKENEMDVKELVLKAIEELKQCPCFYWNPTQGSKNEMELILNSTGLTPTNELEETTTSLGIVQEISNQINVTVISTKETETEAVLLRNRGMKDCEGQLNMEINTNVEKALFVIVLLSPMLLIDSNALKMIELSVSLKCNLIPVVVSRIGLDSFDFSKEPISNVDSFKVLIKELAKKFEPHSSSEQLSVQLNSIWTVLGVSTNQFPLLPFVMDPYSIAIKKAQQFAPNTREWVFNQIEEALTSQNESPPVFVIVGTAGLGKSVIQAEFCKRYSKVISNRFKVKTISELTKFQVVGLHFFKHDNQVLNNARNAIGSISRQLIGMDGFRHVLEESLKTSNSDELKNLEILFRKAILEPVLKLNNANSTKSILVIDALDECEDRHNFILLLSKVWPEMPLNFGLILTTRPDVEIPPLNKFKPFVLKSDEENNKKDITMFIKWKLKENATPFVVDLLCRNAQGMFLYAMLSCQQLETCATPFETENKVKTLPVSMNDTYIDYFSSLQEESFKKYPLLYIGALSPILASRVPLPEIVWKQTCLESLRNNRSVPQSDGSSKLMEMQVNLFYENEIKKPLMRLLDFGGGSVCVLHKSMDDFLRKSQGNTSPMELQIDIDVGHELISLASHQYFKQQDSIEMTTKEDLFYAGHSLYHFTKSSNLQNGIDWIFDFKLLLFNISASKKEFNFERLLDDVELLWNEMKRIKFNSEETTSLIGYCLNFLQLSKKSLMKSPLELAGQILGRVMPPPHSNDELFWMKKANDWIKSSQLKVYTPMIGRSGLAPAGTGLLKILQGHTSIVTSVAISSDVSFIVTGSFDSTARVWDRKSGNLIRSLKGHTSYVESVAISTDGSFIVTGSKDTTTRVWDTKNGNGICLLEGHTSEVNSVAISTDGSFIVTGSNDKTARVWDTKSGNLIRLLEGHTSYVNSVAISSDGLFIVTGSHDKTVRVWDTKSGLIRLLLESHTNQVNSVAISTDGSFIVTGSNDNTVCVWDTKSGNLIRSLEARDVLSVAISFDGSFIVAGSYDKTTRIWDTKSGNLIHLFEGYTSNVNSVAISIDGSFIVTGSQDCTVRVWDAKSRNLIRSLQTHSRDVNSVAISTDGSFIVTGSKDQTFCVWDRKSGNLIRSLEGEKRSHVYSVGISFDGSFIVTGCSKIACIWDTKSGTLMRSLQGHHGFVACVAISTDCSFIVTGSKDTTARIWNTKSGNLIHLLEGHTQEVYTVAISTDGSFIVTGSNDNTVCVWDTKSGNLIRLLEGHAYGVFGVAISNDGKYIISQDYDGITKYWETQTGLVVVSIDGVNFDSCGVNCDAQGNVGVVNGNDVVGFTLDFKNMELIQREKKFVVGRFIQSYVCWSLNE